MPRSDAMNRAIQKYDREKIDRVMFRVSKGKKELIQKMNEFLNPFREKRKYYENNMNEVDNILKKGTKKAQEEAQQTIKKIKKDMKIDYYE